MGGGTEEEYCLSSVAPIQVGLVGKESTHLQLRGIPERIEYHRAEPASSGIRGQVVRFGPAAQDGSVGAEERQGQVKGRRAERYPRKLPVRHKGGSPERPIGSA
jgi:hypothetical protein